MSSSINLVPDVTVVVVQAGVFLATIVAVKKLMLEPYLKLRAKRESVTLGSQDEAASAISRSEKLTEEISSKVRSAMADIAKDRELMRTRANEDKTKIISAAEAEMKKEIEKMRQTIRSEFETERSKLGSVVTNLTQELFQTLVAG